MKKRKLIIIITGITVTATFASYLAPSNIDPVNKYAWCENVGWLNWRDAGGGADGVDVGATFMSGFIWGENTGWINVGNGGGPYANTTHLDFGINIEANDDLSGFAWGENRGWINFGWAANTGNPDRARADMTTGRFFGWAWSENDGWINLDDSTHFGGYTPPTSSVVPPGVLAGEPGFDKDRYVSFDPTTNGAVDVAIRVTRVGSVTDKYVDCTSLTNEGADGFYATLIDGPLPLPPHMFYYCNLSGVTTGLHVRGCSVVPGNSYNVAMTVDGLSFSVDLSIPTTPPQWPPRAFGDTVGGLIAGVWTAPDGLVTTNDIVAAVKKFGLDPDAAILARVDTEGAVPNAVASSGDILRAVRGFAGDDFGSGVTGCKTGQCVPPQSGDVPPCE